MLNVREKLIELLYHSGDECDQLCRTPQKGCHVCKYADCGAKCINAMEADYLIANGVTMRAKGEWDDSGRYQFMDGTKAIRCTECGCALTEKEYAANHWNFCPVCGADMRPDASKDGE